MLHSLSPCEVDDLDSLFGGCAAEPTASQGVVEFHGWKCNTALRDYEPSLHVSSVDFDRVAFSTAPIPRAL